MKITQVKFNNRRKSFTIDTPASSYAFPYNKCNPVPIRGNFVREAFPDAELGYEAFTYKLESGAEGTIHLDSILEENKDPETLKELFIYNLTMALRKQLEESNLSRREIIRKMATSPSHFYRIIEPSNKNKSIDQILKLFYSIDCDVEMTIKPKTLGNLKKSTKRRTLHVSTAST